MYCNVEMIKEGADGVFGIEIIEPRVQKQYEPDIQNINNNGVHKYKENRIMGRQYRNMG